MKIKYIIEGYDLACVRGGHLYCWRENSPLIIADVKTGRTIRKINLPSQFSVLGDTYGTSEPCLQVDPTGRYVLVYDYQRSPRFYLYDLATNNWLSRNFLALGKEDLYANPFSPDGSLLCMSLGISYGHTAELRAAKFGIFEIISGKMVSSLDGFFHEDWGVDFYGSNNTGDECVFGFDLDPEYRYNILYKPYSNHLKKIFKEATSCIKSQTESFCIINNIVLSTDKILGYINVDHYLSSRNIYHASFSNSESMFAFVKYDCDEDECAHIEIRKLQKLSVLSNIVVQKFKDQHVSMVGFSPSDEVILYCSMGGIHALCWQNSAKFFLFPAQVGDQQQAQPSSNTVLGSKNVKTLLTLEAIKLECKFEVLEDIRFTPDDSALAIVSSDWVRVYPFCICELHQSYLQSTYSPEVPIEISSTVPMIWDSADPILFTTDSRFLVFAAAQVERDRSFVLIYDLYHDDLHWFFRVGDELCRSLSIVDNTLCFDGPDKTSVIAVDIPSRKFIVPPTVDDRSTSIISRSHEIHRVKWSDNFDGRSILNRWIAAGLEINENAVRHVLENDRRNLLAIETETSVIVYALDSFQTRIPEFACLPNALQEKKSNSININPRSISGIWTFGWALDAHTLYSIPIDPDNHVFETKRTEMGEAIYKLKYRGDKTQIEPIAETIAEFIHRKAELSDIVAILAVPPSNTNRPFQPVPAIAAAVSKILNLPFATDYLLKIKQTTPLKGMSDAQKRHEELEGAFAVTDNRFVGKHLMLIDDLFRSGETLNAVSTALISGGKVAKLSVITATITRSRR